MAEEPRRLPILKPTCGLVAAINMTRPQSNDPLHGITLETVVTRLVDHFGWRELGERIPIRCFTDNPSVKSSLIFLRKTPWARTRVEALFVRHQLHDAR